MITGTTETQPVPPTEIPTGIPTVPPTEYPITYEVSEYQEQDRHVEVTYTRISDNYIYKRNVNIPHLEDGSVDEIYFQEILEGQLGGVAIKLKIGVIEFSDPNEVPTGIGTI